VEEVYGAPGWSWLRLTPRELFRPRRVGEVGTVQQVVELRAELGAHPFGDRDALCTGEVKLAEPWSMHGPAARLPTRPGRERRKRPGSGNTAIGWIGQERADAGHHAGATLLRNAPP